MSTSLENRFGTEKIGKNWVQSKHPRRKQRGVTFSWFSQYGAVMDKIFGFLIAFNGRDFLFHHNQFPFVAYRGTVDAEVLRHVYIHHQLAPQGC